MRYEGNLYRPPSEARSLIIQATIGCSHNQCTFCSMYKDKQFRIRSLEEIMEDLETAKKQFPKVERIFLADGNALALKTEKLKEILLKIKELFPECQRVSIYSGPKDILRKSLDELKTLNELGLSIAYLGIESGSDNILTKINKGVTAQEITEAGKKIMASGIKLSATIISGLGSKENWEEHALASAKVASEINPDYLALLTLLVQPGTKLYEDVNSGKFQLLTPKEVLKETKVFIENLDLDNCVFRSNHASNYVTLAGTLSQEQDKLLNTIESALEDEGDNFIKEEGFRRL
ncbi:radical SAM protein [Natranaerobius thermophilus]|uniref:Radical SAM domain protein n=1 Tax=Natranaerobius thermophilus (strain ATCC BAA-1301 / DSM 18059 / JW/NM-WN-LF) TaxID=457570 RepID=B2A1J4_NATTJ|nr:radical SAM protein [Natranaerobius thermophilus]ACB84734.1 Radical SAM domain protein [Natranaerobius thermophilus JW/NM-WN-LF]